MKRKIFITGATGFVGSWLTRALVSNEEDVSILVRNKNKLPNSLQTILSKLKIYEGSLLSESLDEIIDSAKPNVVFHLAAHGAKPSEEVTMQDLVDTNLKGLIRLINAVKKQKLELFVNTGSSSEYGIKDIPMKESDVLTPINDYGVSKAAAALYCQKVALTESLPIITLRLFSPYGSGDAPQRLISFVIQRALQHQIIELSSKTNVRDFIYVEDVVQAYIKTLSKTLKPGEIINIGSGKQHSTYAIVKLILTLCKSKSKLAWDTKAPQKRQIEPQKWEADITKAKRLLDWEPKFSLEQGLEKTIQASK